MIWIGEGLGMGVVGAFFEHLVEALGYTTGRGG